MIQNEVEAVTQELQQVKESLRKLVDLEPGMVNRIIDEVPDLTAQRRGEILTENQKDLDRMDPNDPKYDRLMLTESRLIGIEQDLRAVAKLPSPLGITLESKSVPSGLQLTKITVPLGVIAVVYESRPNVTFDVFSLCFKAGNATVLKGSRDAHFSNQIIIKIIREVLHRYGLAACVYLAPSERSATPLILNAVGLIDVIIPRGSSGLINFVRENSQVPVIETGAGIVHTYYDQTADLIKGQAIIENAKTRRVSVCNALDTLLIHRNRKEDLVKIFAGLDKKHQLTIYADPEAFAVLRNHYDPLLLVPAVAESFGTEFLSMKLSVKVVDSLAEALDHIDQYSSKHSEAIIAESQDTIERFMRSVDAATVYANASTAYTDGGEFGLGAEIGISTQKTHARGPMGLREITSYKWLVRGDGHVRP
ncbi:MAG: glutamate-5-semialdehyde dehydrogenase [Saprospiraceae bacterium]|nr:glutamate-5-semialdehyde dehydrogenase [Saprospiraceae bacterium]